MSKPQLHDEHLVSELIDAFIEYNNYTADRGLKALLRKPAIKAAEVCKDMKVGAMTYVRAVLAYQSPQHNQKRFTPSQLAPLSAKDYVYDYIQSASSGRRNLTGLFEAQCRTLGIAMEHGVSDAGCLSNESLDFYPWFRILMTAEPNPALIDKYGSKVRTILENDVELAMFLKNLTCNELKLDLKRIPNYDE